MISYDRKTKLPRQPERRGIERRANARQRRGFSRSCGGEYSDARSHGSKPLIARSKKVESYVVVRPASDLAVSLGFSLKVMRLLKQWREETGGFSLARQKQFHPTYLKLIGMGEKIIPYLLNELKSGRRFLFVALESVTDDNPAASANSFEEAAAAWIAWGKKKRLI